MPKTKNAPIDDVIEPLPIELEEVPEPVEPVEAVAVSPPSGRKALGGKEPIPFKWKLVGNAEGLSLTLFKSVEREDADAQLDRVRREGYYTDLRVMDIAEKVIQPKGAKPRPAEEPRNRKQVERPAVESKPPAKRPAATRVSTSPLDRSPPKKEKGKVAVAERSTKSKAAVAKSPAKRTAKRK